MKLPVGFACDGCAALVVGEVTTRGHRHPNRAVDCFIQRIDVGTEQKCGHKEKRRVLGTWLAGGQQVVRHSASLMFLEPQVRSKK